MMTLADRSMNAALYPLILSALVGCTAGVPAEGRVRLGQIAYVSGPRVRVDRVIEDSRCPVDVQCVWSGRLVVRATLLGHKGSKQLDLTLGTPVAVADGMLTLVAATPLPRKSTPRNTMPTYRFTLDFEGGY